MWRSEKKAGEKSFHVNGMDDWIHTQANEKKSACISNTSQDCVLVDRRRSSRFSFFGVIKCGCIVGVTLITYLSLSKMGHLNLLGRPTGDEPDERSNNGGFEHFG